MAVKSNTDLDAITSKLDQMRERANVLDPRDPMRSARALIETHFRDPNGQILLHQHRGSFWLYNGTFYQREEDRDIRSAVWKILYHSLQSDAKRGQVGFKPNSARVSDVLDALKSVCNLNSHVDPPVWLGDFSRYEPAAEFVAMANGLFHLPSGRLLPPTPNYFVLNASGVTFSEDAPEPKGWLTFQGELFGDDIQATDALQEYFGYSLAPDMSQQKIMLIVGPTRSGKGTIARVLTALLGKDNVVAPTLAALSTNFGLAPLIGKNLAIISDARLGSRSDQVAIAERLLSISGEDTLTIDRKYLPAFTGRLQTKFLLLGNELPRLSDNSGALTKRFLVLVLKRSFYGNEDPALTDRLVAEAPGIFNLFDVSGHWTVRAD